MPPIKEFGAAAQGLSKGPLGIIALFILLVYGSTSLVLGFSGQLTAGERQALIWFLVVFPCLVLGVFAWLVAYFHINLYPPSAFRKDETFIEANKAQIRASVAIGAAIGTSSSEGATSEDIEMVTKEAAQNIARKTFPKPGRTERLQSVLWVNDKPERIVFERKALEEYGIQVTLSTSTEDALRKLEDGPFDAIISDIKRPGDDLAGYTLLEKIRSAGNNTPYIIYTRSSSLEKMDEAKRRGALEATNRPDKLLQMVLKSIDMD